MVKMWPFHKRKGHPSPVTFYRFFHDTFCLEEWENIYEAIISFIEYFHQSRTVGSSQRTVQGAQVMATRTCLLEEASPPPSIPLHASCTPARRGIMGVVHLPLPRHSQAMSDLGTARGHLVPIRSPRDMPCRPPASKTSASVPRLFMILSKMFEC